MKDKPSKELLSAYLDGEVSPSQELDIERHLGASADAQQELADYRRISELIQGLPVESAPPEFRTAVLHAAERQMLLPACDPPDRISGSRPVRRRRRWLVTGGVLASAAMMFLAVRLFDLTGSAPPGGSQDVAMQDVTAASASPAGVVSLNKSLQQAESDDNARRKAVSEAAAVGQGNHSPDLVGTKRLRATGTATPRTPAVAQNAAERVAKMKARPSQTNSGSGSISGGRSGLVFGSNLKNAHVGQAVQALERSGDRVTVITLTVVDRQVGLDDLQILLARHQIPKVPGQFRDEKSSRRRQKKAKRDLKKQSPATLAGKPATGRTPSTAAHPVSGPGNGELVAVYVQATPKQLAGVLGELQRRKQFVGLNIGRAIAVAQLDTLSRRWDNGRKHESQRLSRPAKDAPGRKTGTVVAAKSASAQGGKKVSGKPAPQKAKPARRLWNSDADVSRPSRQFRLTLPAVPFESEYRRRRLAAKSTADDRRSDAFASDHKRKNRLPADKNAKDGKANRRAGKSGATKRGSGRSQSVQVLFVLVNLTDHGKSRQPPSRPRPSSKQPARGKPASGRPRDGTPG